MSGFWLSVFQGQALFGFCLRCQFPELLLCLGCGSRMGAVWAALLSVPGLRLSGARV